jgi:hypothetical protein
MQNWYSQNKPRKSKGVDVGSTVGNGAGVFVPMEASVVATASSIWRPGVGEGRIPGREQDARMNTIKKNLKNCLIRRLYSFSEQINDGDVIREKE